MTLFNRRFIIGGMAFLLCVVCGLCRAGEEKKQTSVVRFTVGENAYIPVWLVAGPFSGSVDSIEKNAGISQNEGVVAGEIGKWMFRNVGGGALDYSDNFAAAPGGISYAASSFILNDDRELTIVLGSVATAGIWLDGKFLLSSILDPVTGSHGGRLKLKLKAGRHNLLVSFRAAKGAGAIVVAMAEDNGAGGMRAASGVVAALNLRGVDNDRMRKLFSGRMEFSTEPRFIGGGERMRFVLKPGSSGVPLCDGEVRMRIGGEKETWIKGESKPRDAAGFIRKGMSFSLPLRKDAEWGRHEIKCELLLNGEVVAEDSSPVFCEKNLERSADEIRRKVEARIGNNSTAFALAKLSVEQAKLLRERRGNRTLMYGEHFNFLLERARLALEMAAASEDPLARSRGIQEGAYICRTDGSAQPYLYYVPSSYDPKKKTPMVVLLHGYVPDYDKLRWMRIRDESAMLYESLGCILLIPFGRSNTDFLSIGEVDTLRSIEELTSRYSIDRDRIYLAGYSMGGSGAWTMLSHYPDRFAGALIWSGRTDYFLWHEGDYKAAGVTRDTIPKWKRWLIEADNPCTLAQTLRSIPVRALHPPTDTVVKPDHTTKIHEFLKPPLGKMVLAREGEHAGQGMGDFSNGHWAYVDELTSPHPYMWLLQNKRDVPKVVRHICYLPKYGRKFWIEIEGIKEWGKPASIEASYDEAAKKVVVEKIENVSAFKILQTYAIDSKLLVLDADLEKAVILPGNAGEWVRSSLVAKPDGGASDMPAVIRLRLKAAAPFRPAKTKYLSGPVKEAFNRSFVLVVPTGGDESQRRGALQNALRFQSEWESFAKGKPQIVKDRDIENEIASEKNLILFGCPESNLYLKTIADALPYKWLDKGYSVGGKDVEGEGLGLVGVYPNPRVSDRLVVVIDGLFYGDRLSINHKWDLVPDFIIFGSEVNGYDSTNKARLAGLFDANWKYDKNLTTGSE